MAGGADVVVVGGRVAGALTAIRLVRAGVRVRLLEARHFPADTLSTHFFRGDGLVRSLAEVDVLDEVLASGAPPLTCEYRSVDGATATLNPPQDPGKIGFCLSVRRVTLDAILARRAEACGVDLRTDTRVTGLLREGDRVAGVVDQHGEAHRAEAVIGADGRRSSVARLVAAEDEQRHPPARAMYYRYARGWRSPSEVGPDFSMLGNELAYVFPSDGDLACVALSLPLSVFAESRHDAAAWLAGRLREHRSLVARLETVTWVGGLFAGLPADSVVRRAAGPGWALVGDAGTAQDPWAGLGMDTAARQAEQLAARLTGGEAWIEGYARARAESTLEDFEYVTRHAPDLRTTLG